MNKWRKAPVMFMEKGEPYCRRRIVGALRSLGKAKWIAFSAKVDAKIAELEEKKREIRGWLQAAKDVPHFGREWNEALEKLCGAMMRDKEFFI